MSYTPRERAQYAARIHAYEQTQVWHARRDQFLADHGRWCDACGATRQLHVHHRSYARAFGGLERDEDLRVLCQQDHETVHALIRRTRQSLAAATDAVISHSREPLRRARRHRRRRSYTPLVLTVICVLLIAWAVFVRH